MLGMQSWKEWHPCFQTPCQQQQMQMLEQCANEKKVDGIIKWEEILEANMKTLCSLIWGQCTEVLQANIIAVPGFEDVSDDPDSLAFLVLLKNISYNFQT